MTSVIIEVIQVQMLRDIRCKSTTKWLDICNECELKSSNTGDVKNHGEAKHEGILFVKCVLCDYEYHMSTPVKRHKILKHNNY